jgi:hypothetical protein
LIDSFFHFLLRALGAGAFYFKLSINKMAQPNDRENPLALAMGVESGNLRIRKPIHGFVDRTDTASKRNTSKKRIFTNNSH